MFKWIKKGTIKGIKSELPLYRRVWCDSEKMIRGAVADYSPTRYFASRSFIYARYIDKDGKKQCKVVDLLKK